MRGRRGRAAAPAVDLRGGKRGRGFRSEENGEEWRARVFDGDSPFILFESDSNHWIANEWSGITGPGRPSQKQPISISV